MPTALLIAFSGPSDPDRDHEYNEWYDSVHVADVLRIPGVVRCTRYKLSETQLSSPGPAQYVAIFEVDRAAVASLPEEMAQRFAAGELTYSDVSIPSQVAIWVPVEDEAS